MTLLVPFDGSELSKAALRRATEFSEFTGEPVLTLTVLPEDEAFARQRGWVEEGQSYEPDDIAARLEREVESVAPDATFRWELAEDVSDTGTPTTDVARTVRQVAEEVDATIVFVGSENAGQVSTPVTSVGSPVSEDPRYDVHIVRHVD